MKNGILPYQAWNHYRLSQYPDPRFKSVMARQDRDSTINPNRYKVGSEINPALPTPTVKSGYEGILPSFRDFKS
jgi:hypothetical protein